MTKPDSHGPYIIFDFDSTLVQVESFPELARISLRNHPERVERLQEVERITELTATGQMSMAEGITRRIEILAAHQKHLRSLVHVLKRSLTPSVKRNRQFFKKLNRRIYVLSNGFREVILPVIEGMGLSGDRLFANSFVFDDKGYIVGFDSKNPLVHQDGKARVVRTLQLGGEVYVLGDGYSDMRIKEAGLASRFYALTENVRRESVVEGADHVLTSLDEFLYVNQFPMSVSYPKTRIRVLLLETIHLAAAEHFEKEGYTVRTIAGSLEEGELIREAKGTTLLGIRSGTRISRRVVESVPGLRGIGAFCIGTNHIDLAACSDNGVIVFNAPYANTRSVVELAIGEMLMLARRAFVHSTLLHSGVWEKTAEGSFELRGKKLGIVGYGNIGSQLSVIAEALGLEVHYYDVVEKLPLGNARKCVSLADLLKRVDIVSVHVDGNPHNRNLFGSKEFRTMRDGALFLNLSRGFVVDLDALAQALESGKLGGAAVDVFPEEPSANRTSYSSSLRGLPNVILTPHIGGSTREAQRNIAEHVAGMLISFINSGNSVGSVNFPVVQLPALRRAHRFIHIHANEPGVLASINRVMAENDINILGQYLKTNERLGYVITDVSKTYDAKIVQQLKSVPHTVHFRVLY
ncbi:MAG TPA: phosphoglycerate dehydrogenase [Vicinamibacteria bacterium]|nr:phosphoglycerate dehydrogenase [Vicinamibacteria bacterium]